jgi:hypothetical protein
MTAQNRLGRATGSLTEAARKASLRIGFVLVLLVEKLIARFSLVELDPF